MSKIHDRVKFNGTMAGNVLTVVSAYAGGWRTPAQAISDSATRTDGIKVGDTNVPFVVLDASGNWESAYYTVTDSSHLTRTRTVNSSNSGAAIAFAGSVTAFNTAIAETYQGAVDPDDVGYDIILLLGQSNMAGRGVIDVNVDVPNSRVFQFGGDGTTAATYQKIALAQEPLAHAESASQAGTGVGPGLPFGRAYAAAQPSNRTVLLVPCAMGSTGLVGGAWAPNAGANLSTQAVSQAQAALAAAQLGYPNSRIVGALWAQGEADAGASVAQATYASTLKTLFAYFRTALSAPSMWFIIHGMNPDYVTASGAAWTAIQTALQQVAAQTDHCAYIAGPAGAAYDNGVHYSSAGYRVLGAKSAALVPTARRFVAPVSNASAIVLILSSPSSAVGTADTVTVTTDNPLTGSQSESVTLTAPVAGAWSVNPVTLDAAHLSVSVTFTPSAAGSGNITAAATGTPALTGAAAAYAATVEVLTVNTPAAQTVGNSYNVTGTYANVTPTALDYSLDGGTTWTPAPSPTISGGNYSFSLTPASANASQTVKVRDRNNTSVTATSGAYTVNAAPIETITVNTPAAQTAGTAFSVSGTYANGTPAALDYSLDGGTTWTAATSPTISGGTYSFGGVTVASANASQTVKVRDHGNTSVVGTSGAFAVNAAAQSSFTTWSSTDKSASLSTDGLTVTDQLGSAGAWASIRSAAARSSGKYYFEVTPSAGAAILIGIDDGTTPLADFVGQDAGGWGYYNTGATYHAGGGVTGATGTAYTTNDTIGVAFDMDNRTIEWFKNGTSIGKTANATLPAKPMCAMVTMKDKSSPVMGCTANFGASAFKYAPPTGFVGLA